MAQRSKIEWTESTWNPVTGCTKISEGCKNCYAERMALRLKAAGSPNYANGFQVTLHEHSLEIPLRWKQPRTIFVNSMSDLFHKDVPFDFISKVFDVMHLASQHRFQILTKRSDRLLKLSSKLTWPENVWMGVTVENAAIQELQVVSGTFNAEYGQAMSGIVNIITKEGGEKYTGQVKIYAGDYVSSDQIYSPYKQLTTERDPSTGLTNIVSSERENVLDKLNPILNGEVSLSGPVPLIGKKVTFFANARYFYDEGYFYGVEWFKPNGTPGSNDVVAMNPYQRISLQGKLK